MEKLKRWLDAEYDVYSVMIAMTLIIVGAVLGLIVGVQ